MNKVGFTTCLEDGAGLYVRQATRLGTSRSLGVRPARMTLSEFAIHSMMSGACRYLRTIRCMHEE